MSKTNRFAQYTHIKPAALARLKELRADLVAISHQPNRRKQILEAAREQDAEWHEYLRTVRPIKQGKLF
jgi:3-dehydroquinate dehydratase